MQESSGVKVAVKKSPKIAIVTLNWNGRKHLEYFLPSSLNQSYDNYFVVVVDNGSTDDSINFIRNKYEQVKCLSLETNQGYSRGFNKGIFFAISKGAEYILITNNDVVLDKEVLVECLTLAQSDYRIGYIGGKVFDFDDKKTFQYAGGREGKKSFSRGSGEKDIGQYESVEDFKFMDDVCSFVSVEMINAIGPYDEDFFFDFEETEWNTRIIRNSYRIVYNPKMKVWHRNHGSTEGTRFNPIPEFYHFRGHVIFIFKSSPKPVFDTINLIFVKLFLRFGVLIKHKHINLFYQTIRGVISGLKRIITLK